VQVGDPFAEKLLIEATLELMASGAVAAIQDMGAAGLTSSSVEMAGKGGVGIELNMDNVPQREEGMSAYEMMLSESQERMLAVLKPGREEDGTHLQEVGPGRRRHRLHHRHRPPGAEAPRRDVVCDVPLAPLFDDAPLYDRPWVQPELQPRLDDGGRVPAPDRLERSGAQGHRLPRHGLQALDLGAVRPPRDGRHPEDSATGADAGVVRCTARTRRLAVTSDCTPRYVQADPYEGGKQAVAEAWRNLTAVGAEPIAITDNLNFGNPSGPRSWARSSAPSTAWPRPAASSTSRS
jgi:phosphoribosylformylglycinamidine (FGAM) synthase-like enzyme